MSFSITNNSTTAVITKIAGFPNGSSTFNITSGSLPLFPGQTISGTNLGITLNNVFFSGSPIGRISLFVAKGDVQIDVYTGSSLYSSTDASSGWVDINTPILSPSDSFSVTLKNAPLPVPSQTPTPSHTAPVTPTPTGTPAVTPTKTGTPTPTPSATKASANYTFRTPIIYPADGASNIAGCTGTTYINGIQASFDNTGGTPTQVNFQLSGQTAYSTASTITLTATCTPIAGYVLANDGTAGVYDKFVCKDYVYYGEFGNQSRWSGTTYFYSGNTQLPYTEHGIISQDRSSKFIDVSGDYDTGYFNVLPV